jgi:hypothetical protein
VLVPSLLSSCKCHPPIELASVGYDFA